MLFNTATKKLVAHTKSWKPSETEIESLIVDAAQSEDTIYQIFKERILILGQQVSLRNPAIQKASKKRLDLLGVDSQGNGVVIELKKDDGYLGMETQALTYISMVAPHKGAGFLNLLGLEGSELEDKINAVKAFCDCDLENINRNTRLFLMAQDFDPAVFSIGAWLSENGFSFKCISFKPVLLDNQSYLNFSVSFEASPLSMRALKFKTQSSRAREVYWHNIGLADQAWWDYTKRESIVTASFDNQDTPASEGYKMISTYKEGDTIVAYASGFGAIGFGVVKGSKPEYKSHGLPQFENQHYHRLGVEWKHTVPLAKAISAQLIKEYGLYHPIPSQQRILNNAGFEKLVAELKKIS